jgi:hypothetical protein
MRSNVCCWCKSEHDADIVKATRMTQSGTHK